MNLVVVYCLHSFWPPGHPPASKTRNARDVAFAHSMLLSLFIILQSSPLENWNIQSSPLSKETPIHPYQTVQPHPTHFSLDCKMFMSTSTNLCLHLEFSNKFIHMNPPHSFHSTNFPFTPKLNILPFVSALPFFSPYLSANQLSTLHELPFSETLSFIVSGYNWLFNQAIC